MLLYGTIYNPHFLSPPKNTTAIPSDFEYHWYRTMPNLCSGNCHLVYILSMKMLKTKDDTPRIIVNTRPGQKGMFNMMLHSIKVAQCLTVQNLPLWLRSPSQRLGLNCKAHVPNDKGIIYGVSSMTLQG